MTLYGYYQQKIEPGEGFEIVPESELDEVGPECGVEYFDSRDHRWKSFGNRSRLTYRKWMECTEWNMVAFRRPSKTPAEKAWDEYISINRSGESDKDTFIAGFEAAKKRVMQ